MAVAEPEATPPDAPAPAPPPAPPKVTQQTAVKHTLVDDSGNLYQVPDAGLEQAQAMGLHLAPQYAIQAEKNKIYDSALGGLAAATTGFVSGAIPGAEAGALALEEAIAGKESADQTREALAGVQQANTGLHTAGSLAGALVSPVNKLAAPAGLAGKLAGPGASLVRRAAIGAGVGALEQGLQASIFGAGEALNEAALGDEDVTAEKLLAAAGDSAKWGIGLGLGFGGLGGALNLGHAAGKKGLAKGLAEATEAEAGQTARASAEQAARQGTGAYASEGLADAVKATTKDAAEVEAAAKRVGASPDAFEGALAEAERIKQEAAAAAPEVGAKPGVVDQATDALFKRIAGKNQDMYTALGEAWAGRLQKLGQQEDLLQAGTREVAGALDNVLKAEDLVNIGTHGEAKATKMAKLVDGAAFPAAEQQAAATYNALKNELESLGELATKGGGEGSVQRLGKHLQDFEKRAKSIAELGAKDAQKATGELFMELDSLKRAVGKEAKFGKSMLGLSEAGRRFDALYDSMRVALEDSAVWGKAGEAQAAVNRAEASKLAISDSFGKDFVTTYDSVAGRPTRRARPDAIKGYLGGITDAGNDLKREAWTDFRDRLKEHFAATEQHYDLTPAEQKAIDEGRRSLDVLEKKLGEATKSAELVNNIKRIQAEESARAIGGTPGLLLAAFTQPLAVAAKLGEARQTLRSVSERITSAAKSVVENKRVQRAAKAVDKETAYETTRSAADIGAGEVRTKSLPPPAAAPYRSRAAVENAIDDARELAQDPARLQQALDRVSGSMSSAAPNVAMSMASVATKAAIYLSQKAPPGRGDQNLLQPFHPQAQKRRYSDTEIQDFRDAMTGIEQPLSLLQDLETGHVSRAKVDAVRAVYPQLFREIQQQIAYEASRSEKPLSWQTQVMLATVYQVPTNAALQPAFVNRMQALAEQTRQGAAPPEDAQSGAPTAKNANSGYSARAMNVKPQNMQTPTERIAQ